MRTISGAGERRLRATTRNRPALTLDQLHTFIAVADLEHVTAAAVALHLSQASVSASIRRLESVLGVPLFHRVGRNVRLTDAGRAVRQLAIRTLEEARQVEQFAQGYAAFDRGEITIAAGRVAGAHLLSGWLAPFVQAHPQIVLRITLAPLQELLAMLHEAAADVVVVGARLTEPDIDTLLLDESELLIVVGAHHPLAADPRVTELSKHRYLAHEGGTGTQAHARQALGDAAAFNEVVLEEGALHAALLAGLGFAVMPRAVVESELADGRLVVVPRSGKPVQQPFTAARRRDLHTPAAEAFWSHLESIASSRRSPGPPPRSRAIRRG